MLAQGVSPRSLSGRRMENGDGDRDGDGDGVLEQSACRGKPKRLRHPGDPPEQPAAPQLPPSPSCPFSCSWLTRLRLRQIFRVAHPRLPEAFG